MHMLSNILQIIVLFGSLFLGVRLGGVGIGLAGGLGVVLLGFLGLNTDFISNIPFDVVAIIVAVVVAIAVMQVAGGLDYLVLWTDKLLRKHPRQLIIWAPVVTFVMTLLSGTGMTAFSTLPVISEVAKENNMRPSRPLAIAVVASQLGICASPVSAAVVWMTTKASYENAGTTPPIQYLDLLLIMIPSALVAILIVAIIMAILPQKPLDQDPEFKRRLADGKVVMRGSKTSEIKKGAVTSVWIYIGTIILAMVYAILTSSKVGLLHPGLGQYIDSSKAVAAAGKGIVAPASVPAWKATDAIIALMLSAGVVIMLVCKVKADQVLESSVFKTGMSSVVCIIGVAWLATTFVNGHKLFITKHTAKVLDGNAWLFIVIVFVAAAVMYSQAVTSKAMMPIAFSLGLSQASVIAAFPAVSSLFILPTYPTLVAAVQIDDTGSTKIGKYLFNHPFFIPGTAVIALSALFAFTMASFVL